MRAGSLRLYLSLLNHLDGLIKTRPSSASGKPWGRRLIASQLEDVNSAFFHAQRHESRVFSHIDKAINEDETGRGIVIEM